VLSIGQLHLGGTERQVALLARGLHQRGIQVAVATLRESGVYVAELREAGIPVFEAGFPHWSLRLDAPVGWFARPPRMLAAFQRYRAWLTSFAPDVVHAFLFFAYIVTPFAARSSGVPVVVAGRRSLGLFKEGRRVALALERVATSLTDLVVANSVAVAENVLAQESLPRDRLTVVPNGLAPESFACVPPASLDVPPPVILCVANLKAEKGQKVLIRAAARLGRGTVVLVGDGPQRSSLVRLARETGVRLHLLGQLRDVPALLGAADVVVVPSFEEGSSNSLLEAMAAGRPIVATAVGGNPEALGSTGLLVPVGDDGALAAAIARLLDCPAEAGALGRVARERAARLFSCDAMVDRHVALYEQLLA
jgi:glycosyltransferase involved in cell wall biosynthesis